MASSPLNLLRRRFAKAIEWRVHVAMRDVIAAHRHELIELIEAHERSTRSLLELLEQERRQHRIEDAATLDIRLGLIDTRFNGVDDVLRSTERRFVTAEHRLEQLRLGLEQLRTVVNASSLSVADELRAHDEALARLLDADRALASRSPEA